ncbi:uncharacterized protein [Clytia hemisphaerica]
MARAERTHCIGRVTRRKRIFFPKIDLRYDGEENNMAKRAAINAISDDVWADLYARLINSNEENEISLNLINNRVSKFISLFANKHGFNASFFIAPILTTINFLLSRVGSKVTIRDGFEMNLNTYWLFVGQPTTGKSSAIKHGITEPIPDPVKSSLISTTTGSGLTKLLSKKQQAYIVNSEISDYFMRFAKNDENSNGEIENLCKLYSGESITTNYATEDQRSIKTDIPFCILGSTQLKNASMMLATIDRSDGFWDRFLFSVPPPFRPCPDDQLKANQTFNQEFPYTMKDIYEKLDSLLDEENPPMFYLAHNAAEYVKKMNTDVILGANRKMRTAIPEKFKIY